MPFSDGEASLIISGPIAIGTSTADAKHSDKLNREPTFSHGLRDTVSPGIVLMPQQFKLQDRTLPEFKFSSPCAAQSKLATISAPSLGNSGGSCAPSSPCADACACNDFKTLATIASSLPTGQLVTPFSHNIV
eukprot:CAMPEP_0117497432 /NCGR_PEP_ID=MMETSP0784-20121206/21179_1 /TAXON_ID=39447 /ORGANISM="" /LENGTH=132 /DNA_ID=CAMNT_0005292453 /DNA_START=522 /DNA_END=920 /DNA_ORIENTATION=+